MSEEGEAQQEIRDRELLEATCRSQGFQIKEEDWFHDEGNSGRLAVRLGRWRVLDDDEGRGLFLDDEGELVASAVGAMQYGNTRVCFSFTADDMEVGEEVTPFDDVEPI